MPFNARLQGDKFRCYWKRKLQCASALHCSWIIDKLYFHSLYVNLIKTLALDEDFKQYDFVIGWRYAAFNQTFRIPIGSDVFGGETYKRRYANKILIGASHALRTRKRNPGGQNCPACLAMAKCYPPFYLPRWLIYCPPQLCPKGCQSE